MSIAKASVAACVLVLSAGGCSSKAPIEYDYGDASLVVEGTEVWQVLYWGNRDNFNRLDADRDGKLSAAEFTANVRRAAASQRALKIFTILDEDGDKSLGWDEYRGHLAAATLVNLDADGDGGLSMAEYSAANQSHVKLGRMKEVFAAWDRNGDERLTEDELAAAPTEHGFYSRDKDGDNLISEEEFVPAALAREEAARMRRDFRRRDINLDGKLTFRELFFVDRQAKFWVLDRDGDNAIGGDEFMKAKGIEKISDPRAAFDAVDKNSDGRIALGEFRERSDAAAAVLGLQLPEWPYGNEAMFKELDSNADGKLTVAELVSQGANSPGEKQARSVFEAADSDGDGRLTKEEFAKAGEKSAFFVVDADRDGVVLAPEFHAKDIPWATGSRAAEIFSRVDADGSGGLDYEEFRRRSSTAGLLLYDWDENDRMSYEEFAQKHSGYVQDGRSLALFREYDRDGSGDLTDEEERNPPIVLQFLQKDRDADGQLSLGEYCAAGGGAEKLESDRKKFKELDKDASGGLGVREYFCHAAHLPFWEMDKNGDDMVALDEFRSSERFAHLVLIAEPIYGAIDLNRDKAITFSEFRRRSANVRFAECDVDMDGRLSLEEFRRAPLYAAEDHKTAFARLDKDTDAALTREEFAVLP